MKHWISVYKPSAPCWLHSIWNVRNFVFIFPFFFIYLSWALRTFKAGIKNGEFRMGVQQHFMFTCDDFFSVRSFLFLKFPSVESTQRVSSLCVGQISSRMVSTSLLINTIINLMRFVTVILITKSNNHNHMRGYESNARRTQFNWVYAWVHHLIFGFKLVPIIHMFLRLLHFSRVRRNGMDEGEYKCNKIDEEKQILVSFSLV